MTEASLIAILLGLVATFFALLVVILGWMGNKVYLKLSEMARAMHNIETDLHGRIAGLDRRVIVNEKDIQHLKENCTHASQVTN